MRVDLMGDEATQPDRRHRDRLGDEHVPVRDHHSGDVIADVHLQAEVGRERVVVGHGRFEGGRDPVGIETSVTRCRIRWHEAEDPLGGGDESGGHGPEELDAQREEVVGAPGFEHGGLECQFCLLAVEEVRECGI
jgi:hypothetical protein